MLQGSKNGGTSVVLWLALFVSASGKSLVSCDLFWLGVRGLHIRQSTACRTFAGGNCTAFTLQRLLLTCYNGSLQSSYAPHCRMYSALQQFHNHLECPLTATRIRHIAQRPGLLQALHMATGSYLRRVAQQLGVSVGGELVSMAAQVAVTQLTYAVQVATHVNGRASGTGSALLHHLLQVRECQVLCVTPHLGECVHEFW